MYFTQNEGKSVVTESFMIFWSVNSIKKWPNGNRSFLSCLNKLLDECNNTYYSIAD